MVVNVTSSATLAPLPLVAVYTASKTAFFEQAPAIVTTPSDVAEGVWRAANDASGQLRFPAGPDAVALAERAELP